MALTSSDTEVIIPNHRFIDTFAITLIMYRLPQFVNCIILMLYALSGSSRAIAGKVLGRIFKSIMYKGFVGSSSFDLLNESSIFAAKGEYNDASTLKTNNPFFSAKFLIYLFYSSIVPLLIHFIISIFIFYCSPNLLQFFKLLSKAMISTSFFGVHGFSALYLSLGVSLLLLTTNRLFDFTINLVSDTNDSSNIFYNSIVQIKHFDNDLKTWVFRVMYHLGIHDIFKFTYEGDSTFLKSFLTSSWKFWNYSLSIHVILLEIVPNMKNIEYIKNYIKSLDKLSQLSPEYIAKIDDNGDSDNDDSFINTSFNGTGKHANESLKFALPEVSRLDQFAVDKNSKDKGKASSASSKYTNSLASSLVTVITNLENFCKIPFIYSMSTIQSSQSSSNSGTALSNTFSGAGIAEKKLKKSLPNIRYKQPLWSTISAFYSMVSRQDIYSGEVSVDEIVQETRNQNTLVLYDQYKSNSHFAIPNFPLKCFICYIGVTSLAFQIVQFNKSSNSPRFMSSFDIIVCVNGIEWNTHFYNEEYMIIIGLAPSSTYDIEVLAVNKKSKETDSYHESLITKYIISTLSEDKRNDFKHKSKIETPLETLKKSVQTTQNSVIIERLKLKKLKKDKSKALNDIQKEIDNLNKKNWDLDKIDEKFVKKLNSLKLEARQLEPEINSKQLLFKDIKQRESQLVKKYEQEKTEFENELNLFQKLTEKHGNEIFKLSKEKESLSKSVKVLMTKNEKFINKLSKIQEDTNKIESEITSMFNQEFTKINQDREKRKIKREKLLAEFVNEIERVEEITNNNHIQLKKLEQEAGSV